MCLLQGELGEDGTLSEVDFEQPLFFFTQDESASALFDDNVEALNFTVPDEDEDADDFTAWQPTTSFQTINGYSW